MDDVYELLQKKIKIRIQIYLLKKLQDSKGHVSYSELADYIKNQVSIENLKINFKEQDPQVNVSNEVLESWGSWKINE